MNSRFMTVCALVLVLAGCTGGGGSSTRGTLSSDGAPDWIKNPPKSGQFLYGSGAAALGERESAKDQARRDLTAQIQISISAQRTDRILTSATQTQNSLTTRLDKKVDDQVRTQVKLDRLPGIEVVEQVDGKRNTYVLVKMDRAAWARSIRMAVLDLDGKIESAYNTIKQHQAQGLNELQQAMRIYKELVPLFSKREIEEDRYRLAAPQSSLPNPPVDPVMIRTKLATLLLNVTVSLPQDKSVEAFLPALTEACTSRGLQVLEDPKKAVLQLNFKVKEVKRMIDGLTKLEGTASGSIKETASGRLLGALEARASAGSGSENSARRSLLQKLGEQIALKLEDQLFTYLTRL